MSQLISIPVVLLLLSFQIGGLSKITILNGFGDILIVWLAAWVILEKNRQGWVWFLVAALFSIFISGMPWYANAMGFTLLFSLGAFVKKRLWQSPLLSFYLVLTIGSLLFYFVSLFSVQTSNVPLILKESMTSIIMPSLLINLIMSFPVYLIVKDLVYWLHPQEDIP